MKTENISIAGKEYNSNDVLFVFALKSESGDYFKNYNVCYTGIGKVQATFYLTQAIHKFNPKLIINLGSAGSTFFKKGELVCCTQFVQRDMHVEQLGFLPYETPLTSTPVVFNYGLTIDSIPQGICGTGDQFETQMHENIYNVVDMEAYALAWVAKKYDIPFLSVKYITDGANEEADKEWVDEVKNVGLEFKNFLKI